jgi:hypothetical protein
MRANGFVTIMATFFVVCLWTFATVTVYRFKHPELTETQLFLKLPQIVTLRAP